MDEKDETQTTSNEPTGDGDEGGDPQGETPQTQPEGQFTQEQLNSIVSERVERERQQIQSKLQEMGFEGLDEVQELKQKEKKRREKRLQEQEKYKELLEEKQEEWQQKLSEKEQRLQELERQRQRERKQTELMKAAQHSEAHKPEQVAQLLEGRVEVDEDGNVIALDADGSPKLKGNGEKMGADELVEDFLNENEHFKRAASGRGAGGSPSDGGGGQPSGDGFDPSKSDDLDHMLDNLDEVNEMARKGEINPFGGGG